MKVTFGRTKNEQGRQGRLSSTPIKINGVEVGQIEGRENNAASDAVSFCCMDYSATVNDQPIPLHNEAGFDLLAAKAVVRHHLESVQ